MVKDSSWFQKGSFGVMGSLLTKRCRCSFFFKSWSELVVVPMSVKDQPSRGKQLLLRSHLDKPRIAKTRIIGAVKEPKNLRVDTCSLAQHIRFRPATAASSHAKNSLPQCDDPDEISRVPRSTQSSVRGRRLQQASSWGISYLWEAPGGRVLKSCRVSLSQRFSVAFRVPLLVRLVGPAARPSVYSTLHRGFLLPRC